MDRVQHDRGGGGAADSGEPTWSQALWTKIHETCASRLLIIILQRMTQAMRHVCSEEDVLQEVLFRAWRKREKLTDPEDGGAMAWLRTITYNVLSEVARKATIAKIASCADLGWDDVEGRQSMEEQVVAAVTRASQKALKSESFGRMIDVLHDLTVEERDLVVMRHYESLNAHEIAERIGISHAACRKRLERATSRMHEARDRLATAKGPVALPHEID